jgi:hypothetical protein
MDESNGLTFDSQPPPLEAASFDQKPDHVCDHKSNQPLDRGTTAANGAAVISTRVATAVAKTAAAAPAAVATTAATPDSWELSDAEARWDRFIGGAVMEPVAPTSKRPFPTCPSSIVPKSFEETGDDVENYTPDSDPDSGPDSSVHSSPHSTPAFHTQPAQVQQSIDSLSNVDDNVDDKPLGADDCIDCGKGAYGQCTC